MGKKMNLKENLFQIVPPRTVQEYSHDAFPDVKMGVRVMGAGDKEDYENSLYDLVDDEKGGLKPVPIRKDTRLKLIIHSFCDPETGELLFSSDDLPALREFPNDVVSDFFQKALEVNGIGSAKDMEKNSQTDQTLSVS